MGRKEFEVERNGDRCLMQFMQNYVLLWVVVTKLENEIDRGRSSFRDQLVQFKFFILQLGN